MKSAQIVVLLLLLLTLWGCAGSAVLTEGENRLVRYQQFDKNTGRCDLELLLVEEKHTGYQNLYSKARDKGNIKQVPESMFNGLVESMEDLGFVEMSKPWGPGSESDRAGISKVISVENEKEMWVCSYSRKELTWEQRENFVLIDKMVRNCFDSVLSLQVITNKDGGDIFLKEQRRLKQDTQRIQKENPPVDK